ncbi:sodium- and chloride-dependent neutral and basic amino acid transporter B(0+) [Hemicordylus capensis]|uniref:sodium- and chloride-dependent neutral and basic amino acid transporter B(0+) n=1 Tax=Hemicordylus capensis TaxID=884348 RepID=UPI00230379A2|nr:sodium- and chloride-dependent neutral and basic amino acid transporter B(0+) [Hemicordylus capensis]
MGWLSWPAFLRCRGKEEFTLSTEKIADKDDENTERGNWSSKTDYLLSMVGYAVGLGNVWRFPYLTYKNGGGAFLIPYTIMLALAGLPLFFMECSLGQFASQGPISVWRILPLFKGVGITMVIISSCVSIYYNVIIAYSLYYFFASFQKTLPWASCHNETWADSRCSKEKIVLTCNATYNNSIIHKNYTWIQSQNLTCIDGSEFLKDTQVPSEQYWNTQVLKRSSGLDETGEVVWYLALCLLLSWLIVAVALFKGIKSSGKIVYFTAIFPYVILVILLVRGATLEGALDGIQYYIGANSDFSKLKEAQVWQDAATQIFFSLSVAWGGLVALSSYNKFNNNCFSDAIFVCVTNCLTSVFAGFAIFSILGHLAFLTGKKVSEVVGSGFNLAFVAYPEALSQLPISPLWSFLFFFMFLLLGLDSQFATIETVTTTIQDSYPQVMKKMRVVITLGLCVLLFFLGLICVTQAGIYWVNLVDHFCAGWGILFAAVLEIVGISWIYGGNRFIQDVEMMLGKKSFCFWLWWRVCWFVITPCLLIAILIWSLVTFEAPTFGKIVYPTWGSAVGWCMISFCLIWIPIVAIYKICKAQGNLWQRIVFCCKPAPNWGPYLECHRGERYSHMTNPAKEGRDLELPTVDGYIHKLE